MPVPESGTLRLRGKGDGRGLNKEVKGNITDTNVSLHQLAIDAGFSTPDNMSEFYGYTSYEQPSISGTSSTSNITDTRICVVSPTYSNPTGGSIERGFYVGTSTNATSNPWYSKGTLPYAYFVPKPDWRKRPIISYFPHPLKNVLKLTARLLTHIAQKTGEHLNHLTLWKTNDFKRRA